MIDDVTARNLKKAITKAEEIKRIIELIDYSDDLSIFFKRSFIIMIVAAIDFIIGNLHTMVFRYAAKMEAKKGE